MTAIFLQTGRNTTVAADTSRYEAIGSGGTASNTTESFSQTIWEDGGTFSNMYVAIPANSGTTTSAVFTYRVGGANGNQTITVSGSSTGEFTDSTHSDTVSATNVVNYKLAYTVGDGTGTDYTSLGMRFAPTSSSNCINKLMAAGNFTDTSVNTTYYEQLCGILSAGTNPQTETNAQFKNKLTATLQNLYIEVSSNTLSVATVKSEVAAATPGNLVVTIGSGVTGGLEDTTHTDSISSGTLINTAVNSTVTTTFTIRQIAVTHLTTSGQTQYWTGSPNIVTSNNQPDTWWIPLASQLQLISSATSNEAHAQASNGLQYTTSNMEIYIQANGVTATSTATFRKGAANGNQTISITSGTTGYLEDTTNIDGVLAGVKTNYQVVLGASGTTMSLANIGCMADYVRPIGTMLPFPWMTTTGNMQCLTGGMRN